MYYLTWTTRIWLKSLILEVAASGTKGVLILLLPSFPSISLSFEDLSHSHPFSYFQFTHIFKAVSTDLRKLWWVFTSIFYITEQEDRGWKENWLWLAFLSLFRNFLHSFNWYVEPWLHSCRTLLWVSYFSWRKWSWPYFKNNRNSWKRSSWDDQKIYLQAAHFWFSFFLPPLPPFFSFFSLSVCRFWRKTLYLQYRKRFGYPAFWIFRRMKEQERTMDNSFSKVQSTR